MLWPPLIQESVSMMGISQLVYGSLGPVDHGSGNIHDGSHDPGLFRLPPRRYAKQQRK